jgi:hypothetical protein
LTEKVHTHGMRYTSLDEHMESEPDEKLNPKYVAQYSTDTSTPSSTFGREKNQHTGAAFKPTASKPVYTRVCWQAIARRKTR